ncbi:glycine cleavage T protein (aminomethyl transferase) [Magnetococcus marinus MC-1]|uniref:Glycine cleavage T protein (Aminomethyl transferase) n=2 Tax=Magnetococcus TaxID=162171 RepID=A0LE27_MAGMM|nr:glycine cleavage T protein (aminomethyl transferase) [Magnetococcus marinus MC-1]
MTFSDAAQEHAALAQGAALVDWSHTGVATITGDERKDFLSGLITNQIKRVTPECAIYAGLLTPQGRYLWDFIIAEQQMDENPRLLLLTEPGIQNLIGRLSMYLLRAKAKVSDASTTLGSLIVTGPQAPQVLTRLYADIDFANQEPGTTVAPEAGVLVLKDPRHAAFGWRLVAEQAQLPNLWERLQAAQATPVGFHAWESYRVAQALPRGGNDLEADITLPLEAGFLEMQGVDFTKGCYVGQETTARTHHRGTLKKRLFQVRWQEAASPKLGDIISVGEDKEAGHLTSISPAGGEALAIIRVSDWESGKPLMLGQTPLQVTKPAWASWA